MLFESVLLLPVIHAGLLVFGYARLRWMMEKLVPLKPGRPTHSERESIRGAGEIARMVSIAAEHGPYRASCLRKSLLVWWFLRRAGLDSTIRFGVRMSDGRLEAHAWVEYNGAVVNDSPDIRARYQLLSNVLPATDTGL